MLYVFGPRIGCIILQKMTSRQRFWQELEEFRNFCNFVTNLDDCFCMADGVLSVDKNKTFLSVIGKN